LQLQALAYITPVVAVVVAIHLIRLWLVQEALVVAAQAMAQLTQGEPQELQILVAAVVALAAVVVVLL